MEFHLVTAAVTLSGSLLSSIASFCVLVCFLVIRKSQRTFRHALVFNLTLADFINATNNSVSGIVYIREQALEPSPACVFNGWLGQLSVQAIDFSVLAISVATLLVVTQTSRVTEASTLRKTAMCLSIWVLPVVTSSVALGLGEISPVSGNWCWISPERTDLRYALGHGWRFAIILITISIYTYVWIFITRHFRAFNSTASGGSYAMSSTAMQMSGHRRAAAAPPQQHPKRLKFFSAVQKNTTTTSGGSSSNAAELAGCRPSARGSRFRMTTLVEAERRRSNSVTASQENLCPPGLDKEVMLSSAEQKSTVIMTTTTLTITSTDRGPGSSHSGLEHERPRRDDDADRQKEQQQQQQQQQTINHFPIGPQAASTPAAITTMAKTMADDPHDSNNHHHNNNNIIIIQNEQQHQSPQFFANSRRVEREIKKMLLLNGYPIAYVVLWLPGILNRVLEAEGDRVNGGGGRVLAILQASTQFIGFANAATYLLSRQWRRG